MIARRDPPSDEPRLQLEPASSRSRLWLWLLGAVLPMALSIVFSLLARSGTTADLFDSRWHVRAWSGFTLPDSLLGPLLVACIALAVCIVLDRLLQRHRLRLDASGLDIVTTLYHQQLSLCELQLDAARVVDIDERPEFKPMFKSNGMAMPGFRSGWFRSRTFKKLFVASAGGRRLLWLPTTRGHALLLQPRHPQLLLERLRELAAGATTTARMTAGARAR